MSNCTQLLAALRNGACDPALSALYALDGSARRLDEARERAVRTVEAFSARYGADAQGVALFSGPGRTEIGGNHTDHQHGRVLCGSVDLDMLACAAPNGLDVVRIQSEGYPALEISLKDLSPKKGEENTSAALVRGVAAKVKELGFTLAGFDAYITSTVLSGSGLSSSAAFEVLMGTMLNDLFWGGKCAPMEIAQIGQYAENVYFGKPSGLMDQAASSVGGMVYIDFADPDHPQVERIEFDFEKAGHALCIIDSGADHADLTDEYAAIPRELKEICNFFGKDVLREVREKEFMEALPNLRGKVSDRAILRAIHFYQENKRVMEQKKALLENDFDGFLGLVTKSGYSSWMYLQNISPAGATQHQEVAVALAMCDTLLNGRGAYRVHGGGFAGTVQAFVPVDMLEEFKSGIERVLGEGSCHVLHIRNEGGVRLS